MTGSHTLTIRTRRDSDRKDGDCSCGLWHARNHPHDEIARMHAEHVSAERIADVRERREAMNG